MRETSQREHGRWRRRGGEAQGQWVADFDLFKAALSHFEIHRENYAVAAPPSPSPWQLLLLLLFLLKWQTNRSQLIY